MTRFLLWTLLAFAALLLPVGTAAADESGDNAPTEAAEAASEEAQEAEPSKEAEAKDEAKADDKSAQEEKESGDAAKADDKKDAEEKADDKAEEKPEEKKDEKAKRKTHKLEAKPFKVEVTVSGDLVAREMTAIELDAESWSKWEIEEIVPHGATVRAGETLVRFDAEDLNEALAKLELEQRVSELSLLKAEQELPLLEESIERQLRDAERTWEQAQEDYSRYTDKERDLIVKSYEMRLKQSKYNLDYVRDELDQLKKMYEEDDLTEETEELILQRQKTEYEFAKFSYEIAKYNNALTLGTYLPRSDEREKEAQRLIEIALERARMSSKLDLARARYSLEKARIDRREELEKHAEMIADKGLLNIKSPVAGVVYYGKCVNGKFGEVSSYKQKLLPEKSVPNGTVLMTVVNPEKLYLFASLGEGDLPSVKIGQSVKLELPAEGVEPLEAKVAEVASIPTTAGKFELEVQVTGDKPDWLVPGMSGKAKVLVYEKKDALLAPKEAVHEDEESGRKYVWVVEEEDDEVEVEKEWVKVGRTKDKQIEILDGVDEGDVLSLDPDEKGTDDGDDDDVEDESED